MPEKLALSLLYIYVCGREAVSTLIGRLIKLFKNTET